MANGIIQTLTRGEARECMDCGLPIEIGDKYYNYTSGNKGKKYIYCVPCKKKPEHCKNRYDLDEIFDHLYLHPMFRHEFAEYLELERNTYCNRIIKMMQYRGYRIGVLRWRTGSRHGSNKWHENYRPSHHPNDFTMYYIIGTEALVVDRVLDAFEYSHVDWRDLLTVLFGKRFPNGFTGEKAIKEWVRNQKV